MSAGLAQLHRRGIVDAMQAGKMRANRTRRGRRKLPDGRRCTLLAKPVGFGSLGSAAKSMTRHRAVHARRLFGVQLEWRLCRSSESSFSPASSPGGPFALLLLKLRARLSLAPHLSWVNFRVDDLETFLAALRNEGCNVLGDSDISEDGKFGWVPDPDGSKIELWGRRPPAFSSGAI